MKRMGLTVAALGLAGLMAGPAQAVTGTLFTTAASAATLAAAAHGHVVSRGHHGYRRGARAELHHRYGYHGSYRGGDYTVRHSYRYAYPVYPPYGYRSFGYGGYGPVYPYGTYYGYSRGLGYYRYPGRGFSFSFGY